MSPCPCEPHIPVTFHLLPSSPTLTLFTEENVSAVLTNTHTHIHLATLLTNAHIHTPCVHLVISMCPDNQLSQWALLNLSSCLSVSLSSFSQMKTKSRQVSLCPRARRQRRTTGGRTQVLTYVLLFSREQLHSDGKRQLIRSEIRDRQK